MSVVAQRVLDTAFAMLQRNLLYTGITRGKRLVVPVGRKKAIAIAVRIGSETVVEGRRMASARLPSRSVRFIQG
jgi:hypothetical protein